MKPKEENTIAMYVLQAVVERGHGQVEMPDSHAGAFNVANTVYIYFDCGGKHYSASIYPSDFHIVEVEA